MKHPWLQPMAIAMLLSSVLPIAAVNYGCAKSVGSANRRSSPSKAEAPAPDVTNSMTNPDATNPDADSTFPLRQQVEALWSKGRSEGHFEIDRERQNLWPAEMERQFWQRAEVAIAHYANRSYGNTVGENEKRSYPYAMFDFLAGNRQSALAFLQQDDDDVPVHAHTEGIDYYYSFTLKGQIRKYFLLGTFLEPNYVERMATGAAAWTSRDPLHRPHPIHGNGRDGNGWGPEVRGGWVDSRNTDNLRAMREVSAYLMAEENENEAVRQIYRQRLQRYVSALYHIGMGEWDSEIYHEHTIAAYLNLYDFAADPEMKTLAQAALDWMMAAGAVKYYRGGFGGPSKRDYGKGNVVFGSPSARLLWHYFNDAVIENPQPQRDAIHVITSSYRPPLAIVALAQKAFDRPLELFSSKPHYENWKPGKADSPAYWETTFWGHTYQMGSVVSRFPDGDLSPFKLMADNSNRGVDYVVINTGEEWQHTGKQHGDQIGQYRNQLIWLSQSDRNFFIQLPDTATVEIDNDIWFIELERTWLALHPINLSAYERWEFPTEDFADVYAAEQLLRARPAAAGSSGFALEVGEPQTHGSYETFKRAVSQHSHLEVSPLSETTPLTVHLRSSRNQSLTLTYNTDHHLPRVRRNGQLHRWQDHLELYRSPDGDSPISLGWKTGRLRVEAGGHQFESAIAQFVNELYSKR